MAHVSDPAERVGKSKGKLDLGVHGAALRDLYSNARPSSAQPSSTSRPSSSRRIRAGIGQAATEPRRNVQDRLSHSESPDRGEAMLQPQFDTLVEEIAGVPSQIPKLVLSGVPSARGKLSSRQMLARTAHADRMAVKAALDRFGFSDADAKWEPATDIAFHTKGQSPSANQVTRVVEREDKEPTAQQAASRLGARLDPVHPASNPDAFASQNSPASTAIAMPEELVDLSQMAVALANAKNLGERVAKAAQVSGIIGVRRAGYNPMLSKYEQRMPKPAALYLARGRGGLAPYAGEKVATSRARIERSDLSHLTQEAPADHVANIADEMEAMVRPALLRLAKHKERRCEFKSIPWVLRDQLRLPRTSRNFQTDNAADIEERFNPFRRQVEEKERAAHHATRIKTVHSRAIVKAQESRQQFVEKEKVREQRLHDKHRQEQMLVQLQGLQRSWLKHLVLFHSAHLLLHAATLHTHLNAINKAPGMAYLHTHRSTPLVTRAAATTRQRMALRQKQEAQRTNTLALIRWTFENRNLLPGRQKNSAIYRMMLRRHYHKQVAHITHAATVVGHILVSVGHLKSTMFTIRLFKGQVIKCQRLLRKALMKRDKHLLFVLTRVKEMTAHYILREIIAGLTSMFPATSAFASKRQLHLAHHHDINLKLMRNDDLNNYARIFPGLPLWIAIALDKLSRELIRVYSVEYSVNLQTSKVWDNLDRLFRDGMLPQADAKDVTWAIYKNLVDQSLASWDQFLRQRELHQQQEAQQNVIDDALKGWGPQAMAQWQDQKMKLKPLAKPLKPTFPIYGCSPVTVLQAFQGMHASNVAALAALHRKLMPPTHASSQSGGLEAIERQHSGPRHLASEAQAGELASERQERRRLEVEGEERRRVRMDQEERRLYDDERRLYDVYPDHIMRCRVQMDQEERRREQLRARLAQQDKFLHVQAATQLAFRDMLPCLSPMVHGKTLSGVATHGVAKSVGVRGVRVAGELASSGGP